jgi:hypothetical protein
MGGDDYIIDENGAWGNAHSALVWYRAEVMRLRTDATRYQWLRDRDLDQISLGGVFAGRTPENEVLNGVDLDSAIDSAMTPNEKLRGAEPTGEASLSNAGLAGRKV